MADYSEKLKTYIEQARKSFETSLQERIKRLAKEEREEQLYTGEKLQQAGKFTSGFRKNWMERVMDIFAGRKGEVRGEYDEKAYAMAMQMLGLSEQEEQARLERESRESLTREGYALQKYLASLTGRGAGAGARAPAPRAPAARAPAPTAPAKTTQTDYEKKKSDYYYKKYAPTYPQYGQPATGKTYDWRTEMAIPRTYGGRGGKIY